MDPRPKVLLSEFVLKFIVDESSILSLSRTFNVKFSRNGQYLIESRPKMRNDDGCLVLHGGGLIVLAIDIFVVDVFRVDADDQVKLGSVYVDLEDVLQTHSDLIYMHDAIMESDNFPAMQFGLKASLFLPSLTPLAARSMLPFLAFETCSEETTDADFKMYSVELCELLDGTVLILSEEQFSKLRNRCLALRSADDRLEAFIFFAGLLTECHATSRTQMYIFSRMLYEDVVAALGDLDRPMQLDFASCTTSLPDTNADKTIRMLSFAKFLRDRYCATGNEDDLNQAISWLEAMDRLLAGPYSGDLIFDHFNMYRTMFSAYFARACRSKNIPDLDMAVASINKAIELPLPEWALDERPSALHMLAVGLMQRVRRLHAEHDMERAMECVDEALAGVLVGSPEHREYLSTREAILIARCQYLEDIGDFVQAMKIHEELFANVEDSDCSQVIEGKDDLATLLSIRFHSNGHADDADLRQAIDLYRELADGGSDKGNLSLGQALVTRFGYCRDEADLEEAIRLLSGLSEGSRDDARLGQALSARYEHCGRHPEDGRSAISYLSRVATSVNLDPMERFNAAQLWVQCGLNLPCEEDHASVLMDAFTTAMSIIPSIVWIGMPMQDTVLLHASLRITGNGGL